MPVSTVEVEEAEYRGYRLRAVRLFAHWECTPYPDREGLPFAAPTQTYTAATADEALAMARRCVDRLLNPGHE